MFYDGDQSLELYLKHTSQWSKLSSLRLTTNNAQDNIPCQTGNNGLNLAADKTDAIVVNGKENKYDITSMIGEWIDNNPSFEGHSERTLAKAYTSLFNI